MRIDEIKEYVDYITQFVASKKGYLAGPNGLLTRIIRKEIEFLIFLTVVYLITLVVKQRSKSIYRYLVSLTIAVIVLYTKRVSTIFDESIKQGKPTEEVIKGLPPVCICILIRLFHIIPPLKLVYYALPLLMIAYSIYYHNLLRGGNNVKTPKLRPRSRTRTRTHSGNQNPPPRGKSFRDFIHLSLSLFTDFIHSFILLYAYAVLVLLIFINNNYEFTISSINNNSNVYGKIIKFLDLPFLKNNSLPSF